MLLLPEVVRILLVALGVLTESLSFSFSIQTHFLQLLSRLSSIFSSCNWLIPVLPRLTASSLNHIRSCSARWNIVYDRVWLNSNRRWRFEYRNTELYEQFSQLGVLKVYSLRLLTTGWEAITYIFLCDGKISDVGIMLIDISFRLLAGRLPRSIVSSAAACVVS